MGKHQQVICKVCYKEMRSDVLTRHMKQHEKRNEDNPVTNISVTNNIYTSTDDSMNIKKEKSEINDELKKHLRRLENDYQDKIALGKEIYKMVGEGIVSFEALSNVMKDAVETYTQHKEDFRDVGDVSLKPWQAKLLEEIKNPTDRHIIWVVGKACGEGKSWFQKYLKSLFGTRRVVYGINIKANTPSICHVLSKQSLATADIFLFNIGKSKRSNDQVNYEVLEDLKDGDAFASKYNSQQLKIKVPNIVMVFSNTAPDFEELAEDRWRIFYIENEQLEEKEVVKNGPMYYSTIPKKKIKLSNTDDDD